MVSHFSCIRLFVTRWTVVCQTPLSMGILQARMLEWVAMSSSRGSSQPRDRTHVSCGSCIADGFFTAEPLGKPAYIHVLLILFLWGTLITLGSLPRLCCLLRLHQPPCDFHPFLVLSCHTAWQDMTNFTLHKIFVDSYHAVHLHIPFTPLSNQVSPQTPPFPAR